MLGVDSEKPYDLLGVGFGPSNLALAIAISEIAPSTSRLFLERNPAFRWHPGMLLEGSRMQISYLKDLVTMRDPTSRFSFLNYLKGAGRLEEFLNLNELHPSRVEYSRYLGWAAEQCADRVRYGAGVEAVRPSADGSLFEVDTRAAQGEASQTLYARNVVAAPGGVPRIPPGVDAVRAVHSSDFLFKFPQAVPDRAARGRVAVVGDGQSAGEIVFHILSNYPGLEVHLLIPGYALRPTDNSPFVNEQFYSWRSKDLHSREPGRRAHELAELRNTNYGTVEEDLLDQIYRAAYRAELHGRPGLRVHPYARLVGGEPSGDGLLVTIEDRFDLTHESLECDALVLATGYERELDKQIFADILPYIDRAESGELPVTEDYRVQLAGGIGAGLYVQGLAEQSFGLGDTLLSLLPFRAADITRDIQRRSPAVRTAVPNCAAYPPARHIELDEEKIYAVIERFCFATLVSARGVDEPVVTQVPLILDRGRGKRGVLFGHLDRANAHTGLLDDRPVTVLFHGPDSYISPRVYTTDQLPTWNSVTAVVRGTARLLADEDDVVRGLCRIAELAEPVPGAPTLSAEDPRIPRLIGGIVGFEIEIAELLGRFKLSQDRDDGDRRLALGALAETARADQTAFLGYLAGLCPHEPQTAQGSAVQGGE